MPNNEPIEKYSYFEGACVRATSSHSYAKETKEESKELHNEVYLKKITNLTSELEDSMIMERHLKKEKNV